MLELNNDRLRDNKLAQLSDAHNRASERAQENRRRRRPPQRQGTVRLSNTDPMSRANRVRAQLRAKLGEIMSSNLDNDIKMGLARSVQMQLDRVESKISQIRRRERAKQEEKRDERAEQRREEERRAEKQREARRRRRQHDLRERSIRVRRDFLYHADEGGFDPYSVSPKHMAMGGSFAATTMSGAAVSFDVGGQSGVVADTMPAGGDINMLL